jgi:ribosomal protein L4
LNLLATLGLSQYKLLVLTSLGEENIARSGNNLPRVQMQSVNQTGLVDVLKYEAILCTKSAWNELSERVSGKGGDSE